MSDWDDIADELAAEYAEENRYKTAKKTYEHRGTKWHLTLTKDAKTSTYKAVAELQFPTHNERLDFSDGTHASLEPRLRSLRLLRKGEPMGANPVAWLTQYVQGIIDSRLDGIAALDAMATAGSATAPDAAGADETDHNSPTLDHLLLAIRDYKMQPRTNATPKQIRDMKTQAEALIDAFAPVGLASIMHKHGLQSPGASVSQTAAQIRNWRSRGRIPATAAHHLCSLRLVSKRGFSREKLRPDVGYWYIDDAAHTADAGSSANDISNGDTAEAGAFTDQNPQQQ